jgi:glycine dehydrogenase
VAHECIVDLRPLKAELDRFIQAMVSIKAEINAVKSGEMDETNNPLKNAPHTVKGLAG